MFRAPLVVLATLTLSTLTGCPSAPGPVCTEEARSSVSLSVLRSDGAIVPDVAVTFTVDGGASTACDDIGQGDFVCGFEIEGDFVISISAPGFIFAEEQVTVLADECHVISQVLTVLLEEEVMQGRYDEPRAYYVQLIEDEEDCANSWPDFGMNCFQSAWFCPNGSVEIVVTDILNSGSYGIVNGEVQVALAFPGDMPSTFAFTVGQDDTLIDAAGVVWQRDLTGERVGIPMCDIPIMN